MAGRFTQEPAYILHRREYRDTSLLLDVWSKTQGRVALVARSARGPRARHQNLQIFQRLLLSWSGRGEMGTLTEVESEGVFLQLTAQWLMSGFYLNELLVLLLHKHDPHPELFVSYEVAISRLAQLAVNDVHKEALLIEEQKILRQFEMKMFEALGYGIAFDVELEIGRPIKPDSRYSYDVTRGFQRTSSTVITSFLGGNLLEIAAGSLDNIAVLKDAKRIMRITLDHHLGGKNLKSRELRLAMARDSKE